MRLVAMWHNINFVVARAHCNCSAHDIMSVICVYQYVSTSNTNFIQSSISIHRIIPILCMVSARVILLVSSMV